MKKNYELLKKLIDEVTQKIKENDLVEKHLFSIASNVYRETLNKISEQGFCAPFKVPEKEVLALYDILSLDKNKVKKAFKEAFNWPENAYMYGNPYYHILLLLLLAFRKLNKIKASKIALFLILTRLWNGIKYKYIKYCNKNVMDYVLTKMISKRHLVSKFRDPLDLIVNYFVETIYEKYVDEALKDLDKLRILFNQCWGRLDQLFNSPTKTGIANLYYKAQETGEALQTSKTVIKKEDEENITIAHIENKSTKLLELIENIIANIIMNTNPKYTDDFINFVNAKTKLSKKIIELIAKKIHNPVYKDDLNSILLIMFNKLNIFDENTICSKKLYLIVDRKILSSKHNKDVENFKQHVKELLDKILKEVLNKTVDDFSLKTPLIRALTYILLYNIQNSICKNKF